MIQRAQQYFLQHRLFTAGAIVILVLLVVGVGVTVAFARRTPVQGQNCGEVHTLNAHFIESEASVRQAENCFWQAFQHCQAATLMLKEHSLDTGADHTFTIKSSDGKCSIVDTVKHYIVPNNVTTTTTQSCSGLVMQADGLHFIACGNLGSIHLPL